MPIWFDKTILAVTGTRVAPVQRSVQQHGGTLLYNFSQCLNPVRGLITIHKDTSAGVCEALSVHWIKHHAKGGSLWNWLFPNGTLSEQHLFHVMTLHQIGGNAVNQDRVSESWLRSNNILRVHTNDSIVNPGANAQNRIQAFHGDFYGRGKTTRQNPANLVNEILRKPPKGVGTYKKIGIEGKMGGHAMAAWVAEDVAFFDPNFGEFWFPTADEFRNWFINSFWSKSMYSLGLSENYDVFCYSHAA
ncbi:YopT-type cysteine protease domain-containing protein [Microbulbifer sp. SSSA002]|uniref:YopT-type cysteine protease domain-containing protein n=1 Tax=unclassified Microbulbifer TaxID=2619833 RepID=UPI00403A7B2B